jgi:hexosaminidase
MTKILLAISTVLLLTSVSIAQVQVKLMPWPSSVQQGTGQLAIDRSFSVALTGFRDASLDRSVQTFTAQLSRQTGIPFRANSGAANATLTITTDHGREQIQKLGEGESYELTVTNSGAKLSAPNSLGILRGLATFLQLVEITPAGFVAPAVTIKDQPRFPWRGLLIDVSRHFIPLDVLKRNIDGIAAVKMNVLHWHLSDDQGFRVESKKFPRLHEMGSEGHYYTQDEIREFIAYAHDRGIRVVPEFDMPGHSRSWFIGYPELSSGPGPYTLEEGAMELLMDPTRESTYKFLDKFVEEMARLFPDAYFHIGGDEVNGKQWDASPSIQAFKQSHGMKNNQDLQAYFNQRLQKIVAKHHKIVIGWDEILHPDLPRSIVVQSWRGQDSLAKAARQGYSGLLSYGYYLDLMWPAAQHYAIDPMNMTDAATLTPEEKSRILGGEACMWAEWVTQENIDSHIWPRNAAIAERLWSPQEVKDVNSMYARLSAVSLNLEWVGLRHRSARTQMLERMAGTDDISALRVLADVVEPVKDYDRWNEAKQGPIDFHAPLNRMIDAAYPESDVARQFNDLVQAYMRSGSKDKIAEEQIRTWLVFWRDSDAKVHSLLDRSFLLQEATPLSENLAAAGTAGLFALDYLDKSEPSPEALRTLQLALLDRAKTRQADLLLMVAAPVERLVQASATAH